MEEVDNFLLPLVFGFPRLQFLGYGFGAVDAAALLGFPPGAFWKSCVDFWVAALVLLAASAVTTREVCERNRHDVVPLVQRTNSLYFIDVRGGVVKSHSRGSFLSRTCHCCVMLTYE